MYEPSSEFGREIASDYARINTCTGEWVLKLASAVLDVGNKTQTWNAAQRRAIRARHGYRCGTEGCGRRITPIHHIHHYADGGPTSLDNGVPLRFYHHHLVHEGGWTITRNPNPGITTLINPSGQHIKTQALYPQAA